MSFENNQPYETIIESPRGSGRREIPVNEIAIPDCWNIAAYLDRQGQTKAAEAIRETWHLAHDMLENIRKGNKV